MFLGDVLNICETTNVQSYSLVHNIYSSKAWKLFLNIHQLKDWLMHYYSIIQWSSVDKRKRGSFCALVNYLQDENMLSFV